MRFNASATTCCLNGTCAACERCCSAQPPQRPKYSQAGVTREGEGSSTRFSSASCILRRRLRRTISTRSPGSASATKTLRPSRSATPTPSCVRSTIVAGTTGPSARMPRGLPEVQILLQVRPVGLRELCFDDGDLILIGRRIELAAHELEAQIDQIRVQDVGLAVVANRAHLAATVRRPYFRAAYPELAGQADELRREIERRTAARAVARQHVHHVDVPPVIAAEIIVVAEVAIRLADFRGVVRVDAVPQRAVVEHRQIEPRAVPRDEHGRVALEAVEEPLHELTLRGLFVAETENLEPVARAQHDGDRDDALLR